MICNNFRFNGIWHRQSVPALGLFCRPAEIGRRHAISLVWIAYVGDIMTWLKFPV